jgi:hypothetical protein
LGVWVVVLERRSGVGLGLLGECIAILILCKYSTLRDNKR